MNAIIPVAHQYFGLQFSPSYFGFNLVDPPPYVVNLTNQVTRKFKSSQNQVFTVRTDHVVELFLHYTLTNDELMFHGLFIDLLKNYYAIGWHLSISTILHDLEICSLIFEKAQNFSTEVICVSLKELQTIHITAPLNIAASIRSAIMSNSMFEILKENVVEIWYQMRVFIHTDLQKQSELSYMTSAVTILLAQLYQFGWISIGAINNARFGLNSLYFKYDLNEARKGGMLFGMSLQKNNKLRFHRMPSYLTSTFSAVLPNLWPKGVKKGNILGHDYEVTFNGKLWNTRSQEGVDSKKLMCNILSVLRSLNCEVYNTCYLDHSKSKKTTFFFRWIPNQINYAQNTVCINWTKLMNKVKVINGSMNVVNTVYRHVAKRGQNYNLCETYQVDDTWRFRLLVKPFYEDRTYGFNLNIELLKMMMDLLKSFKLQGAKFLCSADFDYRYPENKEEEPKKLKPCYLHSWFLATTF